MLISTSLVLAGVSLVYLGLGVWAVSQIFPSDRTAGRGSHHDAGDEP